MVQLMLTHVRESRRQAIDQTEQHLDPLLNPHSAV